MSDRGIDRAGLSGKRNTMLLPLQKKKRVKKELVVITTVLYICHSSTQRDYTVHVSHSPKDIYTISEAFPNSVSKFAINGAIYCVAVSH